MKSKLSHWSKLIPNSSNVSGVVKKEFNFFLPFLLSDSQIPKDSSLNKRSQLDSTLNKDTIIIQQLSFSFYIF
jgi:hypothetical protein